jgi:hypothetical protein
MESNLGKPSQNGGAKIIGQ